MRMRFVMLAAAAAIPLVAHAKVPPEKARELDGPTLTCMGAEKAGSASGVAEYTGKFVGEWPGMKTGKVIYPYEKAKK